MGIVEQEQEAARAELAAAVDGVAAAQVTLQRAIRRCLEAKLSITEVARLAAVTRQTVYDWKRKAEADGQAPEGKAP